MFAGTQDFAAEVDLENMRKWEVDLLRYMETSHPEIGKAITDEKRISDDTEAKLRQALETFKNTWQA
jgi:F-type H+-transporting ATPase subunit alpha